MSEQMKLVVERFIRSRRAWITSMSVSLHAEDPAQALESTRRDVYPRGSEGVSESGWSTPRILVASQEGDCEASTIHG